MNDLLEFLTSQEIIIVYIVAGIACFLCFIVYLIDKNNARFRQKHNTRELNKLVEKVKEKTNASEEQVLYETPVLETINEEVNTPSVADVSNADVAIRDEVVVEPIVKEPEVIEVAAKVQTQEPVVEEETLQYTDIEPDQVTAQLELKKLTEELRRQEELEKQEESKENIALTNYEEQQEENAIISLEELVKKSKDMYEANELSQYVDEGNEPISLQELEQRVGNKATSYEEPFILENVVPKEEIEEVVEDIPRTKVVLDDFNTVNVSQVQNEGTKVFKSSPIISPIFGIEKQEVSERELELENTANYEKLDAEIKKTNEFLMTLKELQKKLD